MRDPLTGSSPPTSEPTGARVHRTPGEWASKPANKEAAKAPRKADAAKPAEAPASPPAPRKKSGRKPGKIYRAELMRIFHVLAGQLHPIKSADLCAQCQSPTPIKLADCRKLLARQAKHGTVLLHGKSHSAAWSLTDAGRAMLANISHQELIDGLDLTTEGGKAMAAALAATPSPAQAPEPDSRAPLTERVLHALIKAHPMAMNVGALYTTLHPSDATITATRIHHALDRLRTRRNPPAVERTSPGMYRSTHKPGDPLPQVRPRGFTAPAVFNCAGFIDGSISIHGATERGTQAELRLTSDQAKQLARFLNVLHPLA